MRILMLLTSIVMTTMMLAQPRPTPAPEDIPTPVEGEISLAGARCPDITRYLNVRSASSPSLSPDGERLLFTTSITGQPQLWVVEARPGAAWPRQITFGESVTFGEWSPAGDWIAYGTDRGGNEREGFYLITPDGARERVLLAPSESFRVWGGFSPDGKRAAYSATAPGDPDFDVWVLDVATGATRRVVEGKAGLYVAAWRPDSKALVLSRTRGEDGNDLLLVDLASGKVETLFEPKVAAAYSSIEWIPDGSGFYLATDQDREFKGLALFDIASRRLRWMATPERDVEWVELSTDGSLLAWSENANGFSEVRLRDLSSGATVTVDVPAGVAGGAAWAPRARRLALSVGSPRIPGDVWVYDHARRSAFRATESALAGLDPSGFVAPEPVSFRSHDGETIYGLLYLPRGAGANARPPVVLAVHGGPTSQARPRFNPAHQYLLAHGYAVFDLNFRGSTGFGKRFARLDNQRLRPNAVKDMQAAVEWLRQARPVDASRVAVMGGSYGGYLTFAALTTFPDTFKAGVSFVGVSNWITALEGASPQLKASDLIEYGNIDDPSDREFFREISPLTHVDNVRTPLMVLHGANDPRDPVAEADQFVAAIRQRKGDVEYLRFPDEGHGIRKLSNRIIAYRRIVRFLERTLGPGTAQCD